MIFALLFSCKSNLYTPVQSIDNLPINDLIAGRNSYIAHCGSCHQLYAPNQFLDIEWQKNIAEMQERAQISDRDKVLIYQYLTHQPK